MHVNLVHLLLLICTLWYNFRRVQCYLRSYGTVVVLMLRKWSMHQSITFIFSHEPCLLVLGIIMCVWKISEGWKKYLEWSTISFHSLYNILGYSRKFLFTNTCTIYISMHWNIKLKIPKLVMTVNGFQNVSIK